MNIPIHQRYITRGLYLYAGVIALSGLLGAINNARAIITPVVTYTATVVTVALWILSEILIAQGFVSLVMSKSQPTPIKRLGPQPRLAIVGAVLLLWVPRLIPSPVSPETLKRLNDGVQAAAADGAETGIRQALNEGADINGRNRFGQTALMVAAWGEGPSSNVPNHSARPRAVKLLIERGADVNLKDDFGNTALMYAAASLYVFDKGAGGDNANLVVMFMGQTLEEVRQRTAVGVEAVEILCGAGAEVDAVNNLGNTALMAVVGTRGSPGAGTWAPDRAVVEALIRCGAGTDVKNGEGKTALRLAEDFSNLEIANVLREAGAKE